MDKGSHSPLRVNKFSQCFDDMEVSLMQSPCQFCSWNRMNKQWANCGYTQIPCVQWLVYLKNVQRRGLKIQGGFSQVYFFLGC